MNLTTILVGLGLIGIMILIWWYKYYSIKPRKKSNNVKYESIYPTLSMDEYDFYNALNIYSPNNLILDDAASDQAYHFANYCNKRKEKAMTHVGVGNRMYALQSLGATSVSEIYAGGYRAMETSIKRLKESPSHNRTMLGNYTHIGVAVVNKHYVAIYFNIE